jgi:hypothetical protein
MNNKLEIITDGLLTRLQGAFDAETFLRIEKMGGARNEDIRKHH